MNSCKVFVINEALEKGDVTFAAKPKAQLRAVPFGTATKQIVRSISANEQDVFLIFESMTSLPVNITGMALFLTVSNSVGEVVQVKGKINSDIKGMVSFKTIESGSLSVGFYSYDISVKANNYSQSLLSGSYVVQA